MIYKKILAALLLCVSFSGIYSWGGGKKEEKKIGLNIGIDLGTRNTLVVQQDKKGKHKSPQPAMVKDRSPEEESVLDEVVESIDAFNVLIEAPSAICYELTTNKTIDIGELALKKIGKCPDGIGALRIIQDGTIAKLPQTKAFLSELLSQANYKLESGDQWAVIGVPGVVSSGDTLSIREAMVSLGFKHEKVRIVREPLAAAIGEGFEVGSHEPIMVVDIGGGTTDICVVAQWKPISMSDKPCSYAGDEMDKAIANYIETKTETSISLEKAQEIKCRIAAALPDIKASESSMTFWAQHKMTGKNKKVTITTAEVIEAISECIKKISQEVHLVMTGVKDNDALDSIDKHQILLVGGGAFLPGMAECIEKVTGMPVKVPADPLRSVARGLHKIVNDIEKYEKVLDIPGNN